MSFEERETLRVLLFLMRRCMPRLVPHAPLMLEGSRGREGERGEERTGRSEEAFPPSLPPSLPYPLNP